MGSGMRKQYRVSVFCSILVMAFLIGVPVITAWSSAGAGGVTAGGATGIQADPLRRLPSSPEEAHKRLQERKVGWPGLDSGGARSADSVQTGVLCSIPYDTVEGSTTHANGAVKVELIRSAIVIQTVNTTTNVERVFTADLTTGDIRSGDQVRVTDMLGGSARTVSCTLTGTIDVSADLVSGTAVAGRTINVYISTPSTYYGDVPPGVAHMSTTGTPWHTNFGGTLNIRRGDIAYIYSTDGAGNSVMNVVNAGGSLVVYPQYDEVMGFYQPAHALTVHAGSKTQTVGTAGDGFFDALFVNHDIVPGEKVSCVMGSNRSITVSDIVATCEPSTNRVFGTGPANKVIRVTMDPHGDPVVIQSSTNAQGKFDVTLGDNYTVRGTDVYNVAWYDADGDAVVYEFQTFSWLLAEGYTGGGFDTYILLQNPGTHDAEVTMTFHVQPGQGPANPLLLTVAPGERVTVHLDELPGLLDASVSTKVTSTNGATLNAERAMYFEYDGKRGGHDSIGTMTPSHTWYLAEGYTGPGFDTWVLLQNPGLEDGIATLKFQLQNGTAPDMIVDLKAGTRQSIHLDELPGLSNASVSTRVTSDIGVVAERAMYFDYEGKKGGSDSIGVSSPSQSYYLAEGYTGPGFDTWVLVQNPGTSDAVVTMKFELQNGIAPEKVFDLAAGTRQSIHLNELEGLSNASVSTRVTSDVHVVAERAMYFNYNNKLGGHASKAATEPSRGWYLPAGYTGPGFDTWVLVQNAGATKATVTMKFQLPTGTAPDHVFELLSRTRQSVHLNELPGLGGNGVSVSTQVTSSQPIVAERAMYFIYGLNDGGSDSVGIPFTP